MYFTELFWPKLVGLGDVDQCWVPEKRKKYVEMEKNKDDGVKTLFQVISAVADHGCSMWCALMNTGN